MIILSVDYGDKRTGLALCDAMGILASPLAVIKEDYEPKLVAQVSEQAKSSGAQRIVVGLPRNMDGSYGERAEKCTAFAKLLEQTSGIETVLWDERLTTVRAHRALSENNVRGKKRKQIVDAVSAVVILEDYLASLK